MRAKPPFKGQPRAAVAATALTRGAVVSVDASYALEAAHRDFARMRLHMGFPELSWWRPRRKLVDLLPSLDAWRKPAGPVAPAVRR